MPAYSSDSSRTKTMDMTSGNVHRLLISFAMPLLAGNLFQQLYNTVDSIIVGNYVGKEALAAIGSTSQLINTLLGFFMGLSAGGGIVISQFFGAKNITDMRKAVHTMLTGTIILGIIFTAVGIIFSPYMLRLMSTPDDVFENARIYLTIYFQGVIFLMLYNMGSGILRAVGDSRHPLYFLIVSSLVNVVLDIVFVIGFGWGIAGAAYATIIAEAVSVILVLYMLIHTKECYRLNIKEMRISFYILRRILKLGLPGAFQMALTSFSNVFVQGYINHFGSDCMAGYASFNKIDQICLLPMQSISLSATTFVGQNYGADNIDRAKKGATDSVLLAMLISAIVMIPIMIFSPQLVALFNNEPDVIYYGTYFMRIAGCFYIIRCVSQVYAGAMRGFGNATMPMLILLGSFVAFRQLYLFTATRITDAFFPVAIAYPVGWFICSASMFLYYCHFKKCIKPLKKIRDM